MIINIEHDDLAKLSQLVVGIDVEELDDGTGRVTICASVKSDNTMFVLRNTKLDVPVIKFPPKAIPKGVFHE